MRFKPVDEDPMYISMRNFRKEAQRRIEVDFSDAPIAKLYPLPPAPWRVPARSRAPSSLLSAVPSTDQSGTQSEQPRAPSDHNA